MHHKSTCCCCLPTPLERVCFVRVPASLSHSPPLVFAFVFRSWLLRDSSSFVRIPGSLGPSSTLVCFCFSVLAFQGQLFVILESRFLWVPPLLLCDFVLYCPGFSGDVFCGSCLIWVNSPLFARWIVRVILMPHSTAWH